MKHYKLIILIPANFHLPIYEFHKKVWLSYMNSQPSIKSLFVHGEIKNPNYKQLPEDIIFNDIKETYQPGIFEKTHRACNYLIENYTFDYLLRTNLSTFWILPRLLERLKTLPKENCFAGDKTLLTPYSVVGTGLIMNYNLARDFALEKNLDDLKNTLIDDKALTHWLIEYKKLSPYFYPLPQSPRQTIEKTTYNKQEIEQIIERSDRTNKDHYRVKAFENRLDVDPPIYKQLLKHYYNIDLD